MTRGFDSKQWLPEGLEEPIIKSLNNKEVFNGRHYKQSRQSWTGFSKSGAGGQIGEISHDHCEAAGLHDKDTWPLVQNIKVRDLLTLSYFHERTGTPGKMPKVDPHVGACIIKALEFHTTMNYSHMEGEGGFDACCSCIG